MVIDTTGNSDVAAAAGAETLYTDETEFGMQGTGLPPRKLGATYTNTDFTIVDETDMVDVWHFFVYAKDKYADAFDQGQLIDTRERRRIVGDFTITILDQVLERTYPDTIVLAYSNFDTHGYTIDPLFEIEHPDKRASTSTCPIAAAAEGTGRDSGRRAGHQRPSRRRAADPHAARHPEPGLRRGRGRGHGGRNGHAGPPRRHRRPAAAPDRDRQPARERVLTDEDSLPAVGRANRERRGQAGRARGCGGHLHQPGAGLAAAAAGLCGCGGSAAETVVRPHAGRAGRRHRPADADRRGGGSAKWDAGWNYRGMGQFGTALSHLDTLIVALGRAGNAEALPAILEKTKLLAADIDFSHHRACGLALG